jgi:hypothetical protein
VRPSTILFVLLLFMSSASAQTSGRWLRNDVTGCSVWDSDPEAGKTFNWAGNCASNVADGPGVLQWYVNGSLGDRYIGQYENGRMSGRGVFEYRNGDRYDGEFRDDQPNGYGTLSRANGTRYTGMFRDGEPLQPEKALAAPNKYDVELREGLTTRVEVTDADGSRYEGEMRNDERNGRGILKYANGDRYEGDFRDDKMSGWGAFTTKAGDRYEGEFDDDKSNGFGTYKEVDGSLYAGLWTNGCFRQSNRVAAVMTTEKQCSFGVRGRN